MIEYDVNVKPEVAELGPFFKGWKSPPSAGTRARLLAGSDLVVTARDEGRLIGFVTAITDGAMHALVSLVEVLEEYRGGGVGSRMMELVVLHFHGLYDIILITDPDKEAFYRKSGFSPIYGMHVRDFTYGGEIEE
ncbi:MAG: GNAT family N-acetyltransferase [bacterium]|jgi:GNAT superfamily N-acetyltransferase